MKRWLWIIPALILMALAVSGPFLTTQVRNSYQKLDSKLLTAYEQAARTSDSLYRQMPPADSSQRDWRELQREANRVDAFLADLHQKLDSLGEAQGDRHSSDFLLISGYATALQQRLDSLDALMLPLHPGRDTLSSLFRMKTAEGEAGEDNYLAGLPAASQAFLSSLRFDIQEAQKAILLHQQAENP
jgi:hypothetical protein